MRKHELMAQLSHFPPNAEVLCGPDGHPAILAEIFLVVNDHGRAVINFGRLKPDEVDDSEVEELREREYERCRTALR